MCVVLRHCVAKLDYWIGVIRRAAPCVDLYRPFGTFETVQLNAAFIQLSENTQDINKEEAS